MNKSTIKRGLFLSLCLVLAVTVAVSASPLQSATSKALSTNYTLVNLGTDEATVSARYVLSNGSDWSTVAGATSFSLTANGGQKIVTQYGGDSVSTSGQGSLVLSSNTSLGAVVQILARGQTPTSGAYTGITKPDQTYYAPQIFKTRSASDGSKQSSQIVIQDAGTGDVQVTVQFVPFPGISGVNAYTTPAITIHEGASYTLDTTAESNLNNEWTGSAVISAASGQKIAVIVNNFSGPNSLLTYNALASASLTTKWNIPQFTSKLPNGLNTPVIVQNLSGGDIPVNGVSLICQPVAGYNAAATAFTKTNSTVVPANGVIAFSSYANSSYQDNWSGSCVVDSGTYLTAVIVQMRKPGVTEEFAAYEGIPSNGTDTHVIVPLVSKMQSNGFATAVTIQNLDANNAADITITFNPSTSYSATATPISYDATIAAGGNIVVSQRYTGSPQIPNGWYGTMLVGPKSGSTARPIAALVQLTNVNAASIGGDTFMAHLAFTLP